MSTSSGYYYELPYLSGRMIHFSFAYIGSDHKQNIGPSNNPVGTIYADVYNLNALSHYNHGLARYTMDGLIIMVDGTTYTNLPTQLVLHTDYKEKAFYSIFSFLIMVFYVNNTPMNITINPGVPASLVNQSPPPWYVQYLPEFIIAAGIVVTVLTFYFSPELRSIIKRTTFKLK